MRPSSLDLNRQLIKAIDAGEPQRLLELTSTEGIDLDARNERGATPIYYAIENCMAEITKHLLEKGASANVFDINGATPLMHACFFGSEEIAMLLAQTTNPDFLDRVSSVDGSTALHHAARRGMTLVVALLLERRASSNVADVNGYTPLLNACIRNQQDAALLLAQSTSIEFINMGSRLIRDSTALHYAARNHLIPVVRALLDKGANPNVVDASGNTPLSLAIMDAAFNHSASPIIARELLIKGADPFTVTNFLGLGRLASNNPVEFTHIILLLSLSGRVAIYQEGGVILFGNRDGSFDNQSGPFAIPPELQDEYECDWKVIDDVKTYCSDSVPQDQKKSAKQIRDSMQLDIQFGSIHPALIRAMTSHIIRNSKFELLPDPIMISDPATPSIVDGILDECDLISLRNMLLPITAESVGLAITGLAVKNISPGATNLILEFYNKGDKPAENMALSLISYSSEAAEVCLDRFRDLKISVEGFDTKQIQRAARLLVETSGNREIQKLVRREKQFKRIGDSSFSGAVATQLARVEEIVEDSPLPSAKPRSPAGSAAGLTAEGKSKAL